MKPPLRSVPWFRQPPEAPRKPSRRVTTIRSAAPMVWRPEDWRERLDGWLWRHRVAEGLLQGAALTLLAVGVAFVLCWLVGAL